jgi:hypothetical protein
LSPTRTGLTTGKERWDDNDPVRKNLELSIGLRNKIEHRYHEATTLVTSGYAQALLLNFEEELLTRYRIAILRIVHARLSLSPLSIQQSATPRYLVACASYFLFLDEQLYRTPIGHKVCAGLNLHMAVPRHL